MKYDPQFSTAVFIGPSLSLAKAKEILPDANYYSPVKMGDIYRLHGAAVRRILVIDGFFHSHTPVWQRELLSAIDLGIEVCGASSMGALRAAELNVFGMVGVGQIFEWYRDGVVDADDEVALMHGEESSGYRALSEPLVNIRATLSAAVEKGALDAGQSAEALSWARSMFYGERSYPALLRRAAAEWEPAAVKRLRSFLRDGTVNLKEADACALLALAARRPLSRPAAFAIPAARSRENIYFQSSVSFFRAIPDEDGELRSIDALLQGLPPPSVEDRARHSRDYFLALAADRKGLFCPGSFYEKFRDDWLASHGVDLGDAPVNGLTRREWDAALYNLATIAWATGGQPAREDDLLREWAALQGIAAPAGSDIVTWMIAKGPSYFGFIQWNPRAAFLRDLQLRNEIAPAAQPC